VYLIVGVDAGIKAAYAALDLNGRLVAAGCEKEASNERFVEHIRHLGVPSLIACDVKKPPDFVSKLAARFNVSLYSPRQNLSTQEKKAIGAEILDVHMRDAYAAAMKAYRNHANRLRQIDNLADPDKDKLKHLVLQGHPLSKVLQGKKHTPSRKSGRKKPPHKRKTRRR
jgi:uncharacterized protein